MFVLQLACLYNWPVVQRAWSGAESVWDGVTTWEDLLSGEVLMDFGTESVWRSQLGSRVGLGMVLISGYFPPIEIIIKTYNYRTSGNYEIIIKTNNYRNISLEIQGQVSPQSPLHGACSEPTCNTHTCRFVPLLSQLPSIM